MPKKEKIFIRRDFPINLDQSSWTPYLQNMESVKSSSHLVPEKKRLLIVNIHFFYYSKLCPSLKRVIYILLCLKIDILLE